MAHLYPIYVNLAGKKCLIVGGGQVAERKAATLLEHEAKILIVSPKVTDDIQFWSAKGIIDWQQAVFRPQHLEGIFLVFIATDDPGLNQSVAELCREKAILVNAVDDPPNCDFYVPSILRRGSLCLAVSTEGKSPLLAAKLRRELEEIISPEYEEWLEILGDLRERLKKSDLNISARKRILEAVVYSDLMDLLKEAKRDQIEERIEQCMSSLPE